MLWDCGKFPPRWLDAGNTVEGGDIAKNKSEESPKPLELFGRFAVTTEDENARVGLWYFFALANPTSVSGIV